ncbi:hypothetical protein F5882DRAFT_464950 [Hyaloscypha sp. PMI_1271]|nr:hypothetical protein F5882DRAFT_464950 [Hyaloscypha sp. PMI_1271]
MNFSQSQQGCSQRQQFQSQQAFTQSYTPPTVDRQHLMTLPPASRSAFFHNILVQTTAIYILPNGSFSKLQDWVASSIHLTHPNSQKDTFAFEAAQIFYSLNEFAISITTLPHFISWTINNVLKPSLLITRLAVLYGPPTNPGVGNEELSGILELPSLRNLRLIFQDYEFKGFGPSRWLRPDISVISSLSSLPNLSLKLQRANTSRGLDAVPDDIDVDRDELKDITVFLKEPTAEEERMVWEMYRVVSEYAGPRASFVGILTEMGWNDRVAEHVVEELSPRVGVKEWLAEERDVEMGDG